MNDPESRPAFGILGVLFIGMTAFYGGIWCYTRHLRTEVVTVPMSSTTISYAPNPNLVYLLEQFKHIDWVALFTLFVAIFTALLYDSTKKLWRETKDASGISARAADAAEKALVASNRPWLSVEVSPAGPVTYNVNGANFPFNFRIKNIGRSPATHVWVATRILLMYAATSPGSFINPQAELMMLIDQVRRGTSRSFGTTLFPDEAFVQPVTVVVGQDQVDRATEIIKAIFPTLIGSVSYRMGLDDQTHQSAFLIEVKRRDVPRPSTTALNRSPSAIWPDEGEVTQADVQLFRSLFEAGGYAD